MSIMEAIAFQQQQELLASLAAQVEDLVEVMEAQAARLTVLEAAGYALRRGVRPTHCVSSVVGHVIGAQAL